MGSIEISSVAWFDKKLESVTLKVTEYCPEIVGVPLRHRSAPGGGPGGKVPPATVQPYGANPPLADSEAS